MRSIRRTRKRKTVSRKAPHRKRSSRSYRRSKPPEAPGACLIAQGTVTWQIPRRMRGMNELSTWRTRYIDTQQWERAITACVLMADDGSFPLGERQRVRLEIIRSSPKEYALDFTNMAGGSKGIEDILVRLGYLYDDSPKWLDWPTTFSQIESPTYSTCIRVTVVA